MLDLDTELRRLATTIVDQIPDAPAFEELRTTEQEASVAQYAPTGHVSDTPAAGRSGRPAHPRRSTAGLSARRRRGRGLVALAAAFVVLAAIVGVGLFARGTTSKLPPAADSTTTTGPPTVSLGTAEAALLPVDRADWSNYLAITAFDNAIRIQVSGACVQNATGIAPAPVPPATPNHGNLNLFEDPTLLRAYGFGIAEGVAQQQAAGAPSPVVGPDSPAVQSACAAAANDADAPLRNLIDEVLTPWMAKVSSLETSAPVAAAWDQWRQCMNDRGFSVTSGSEFGALVDRAIRDRGVPEIAPTEAALAAPYADCLEPVVAARTIVRSAARTEALAAQSPGTATLERLSEVLTQLSDRYAIAVPAELTT